jgi:hypothetical protein
MREAGGRGAAGPRPGRRRAPGSRCLRRSARPMAGQHRQVGGGHVTAVWRGLPRRRGG